MREYWLDPPEPKTIAYCKKCGCDVVAGIDCTHPATWEDDSRGLICEDCITPDEKEVLVKVG